MFLLDTYVYICALNFHLPNELLMSKKATRGKQSTEDSCSHLQANKAQTCVKIASKIHAL